MGSASLWHLARRGLKVLGLERFQVGHVRGSSHGETRIIRKAYFEHPDYVPLLRRAYDLWAELEQNCGEKLFEPVGILQVGQPDSALIAGVHRSAKIHRLPVESIFHHEVPARFPGFIADPNMDALFEKNAGFLHVEACVRAHARLAVRHGAEIRENIVVQSYARSLDQIIVSTDQGTLTSSALVLCAGPWSSTFLPHSLSLRRKVVLWFETSDDSYNMDRGCPTFCFETPDGFYYGFPSLNGREVKVAEHSGGRVFDDADKIDRQVTPADEVRIRAFVAKYLPKLTNQVTRRSTCMYTMTPDEHFILDGQFDRPRVVWAAGFSGHGFKFAPIIGSVMADFVMHGETQEPAGFLSGRRFGGHGCEEE